MRVYISNYASYKGDQCVQISATAPDWAVVSKRIPELYPSWDLIKSIKETFPGTPARIAAEKIYTEIYTDQVESVIDAVISKLENGDVLCCWCPRNTFCHRYIVMDVLKRHGVECREV